MGERQVDLQGRGLGMVALNSEDQKEPTLAATYHAISS
jgi:hypothetical protein